MIDSLARRPLRRRTASLAIAWTLPFLLVLATPVAQAHGEAVPMHGGIVQVVDDLQYELVVQGDAVSLFLVDHGKPMDATQMKGKLTALQGTRRTEAPLAPAGGNRLRATAPLTLGPGAKVVAVVQGSQGKAMTVRFSLK